MNMTIYGKIEVMDFQKAVEDLTFLNDLIDISFTEDSASISRCIHHPDGMIGLSACDLARCYELRFMEQAFTKGFINKDHGSYSISDRPFQGIGRVVKLCRFDKPEPFAQFYHIITCSNNRRLVWRVGILSFSKEIEEELPESLDEGYQGEAPHPKYEGDDAFSL